MPKPASRSKPKSKSQALHVQQWHDVIYGVDHYFLHCEAEIAEKYFVQTFGVVQKIALDTVARTTCLIKPRKNFSVVYWFDVDMDLKTPDGQMQIAHEAFHGVEMVMESRGVPLCEPTAEARAYYLTAVFGAINEMDDFKTKAKGKRKRAKR